MQKPGPILEFSQSSRKVDLIFLKMIALVKTMNIDYRCTSFFSKLNDHVKTFMKFFQTLSVRALLYVYVASM
jgi:hypothetical protein